MDDPYLRARHEDIVHLGNKLYNAWRGANQAGTGADSDTPQILVGSQVNISDIAGLPQEQIAGIVCFQGSSLSHTSVLANALGIPAVMGIGENKNIREGMQCIVDGNLGQTVFEPDRPLLREYQRLLVEESQLRADLAQLRDQPATTTDGQRITLFANSGLLADLSPGLNAGAEGLGLYRTEIPFMLSETFPTEGEQLATYQQVLAAYRDRPVYMRVLDVGGDKPLPYFPYQEENPALGWRGIRFCLDNSSLLMTQVRAMLRAAAGRQNLRIMLPMVSASSELQAFHELLDDACTQLADEGLEILRPAVGIMVEVPAAISQLPRWRKNIDFVSVGTNDLSQYLLAVDRNNPRVANLFDPMHPAVLNEMARIVKLAARLKLPLSVCGEMASNPGAALLLIGMGVRTLSMSAAQLPRIKSLIRRVRLDDAEQLFAASSRLGDSGAISELVKARMRKLGLDELMR
jgi:phosphoenolpyruvate-protein phosphotransferase